MKGIKILFSILALSLCTALAGQNITVKGTVTDASNGDPVPATSVIVSGTTQGVVSDVDGVYSISAPSDGVLVFSSIGYETMQVYAHYRDSRTETPVYQLCGVTKAFLKAKEKKTVTVDIDKYWLKAVLESGERVTPDGKITLYLGDGQPDADNNTLAVEL